MMPAKPNSLYKDKNSLPRTEAQPVIDLWHFRPREGDYEGEGYDLYPKAQKDPRGKKVYDDSRSESDNALPQTYEGLKGIEFEMEDKLAKSKPDGSVPKNKPKGISDQFMMNALR